MDSSHEDSQICHLWCLPNELLELIFDLAYREGDTRASPTYNPFSATALFPNPAEALARPLDRLRKPSKLFKAAQELKISRLWAQSAYRSWLKNRHFCINPGSLIKGSVTNLPSDFKPLVHKVALSVAGHDEGQNLWDSPSWNLADGLRLCFRTFPNIRKLTFHHTEDLLECDFVEQYKPCLYMYSSYEHFNELSWVQEILNESSKLELVKICSLPGKISERKEEIYNASNVEVDFVKTDNTIVRLENYINLRLITKPGRIAYQDWRSLVQHFQLTVGWSETGFTWRQIRLIDMLSAMYRRAGNCENQTAVKYLKMVEEQHEAYLDNIVDSRG